KIMLEKEGEIFGSTQKKSDFKIILDKTENLKINRVKLTPHKSPFTKEAVLQNQNFNLTIIANRYSIDFYKALLNLAFSLGIGNRKNRLFGNMQIENILDLATSVRIIDDVCKNLFRIEELPVELPLFPTFSKKSNGEKNYIVYSTPLKNSFDFEKLLTNLFKNVIHPIERNDRYKYLIGSIRPRQSSFINFSLQKSDNIYKLYFISYYYENKNFDYKTWKEAVEFIKGKIKEIA
ncbi:MAG: type III-B CRISPR module RAMP protein Cmr1, partial [Thermoproteota archaeon]